MSYRIEKGETLANAFTRISAEEIQAAQTELRRGDGEAVHNVRKALKRLRALLRSLRIAVPERFYREENQRLGEAGRKMSPLRDVHVQLRTIEKLNGASASARRGLRAHLLREQMRMRRNIPKLRQALRGALRRSQERMSALPLQRATPENVAAGLKKIYKQGRDRFKAAARRPTPENLHEWRKKVKALGYGFELMQELAAKKLAKLARRCDELGELLGDDHDLFMALEALRQEHAANPAADYAALANCIERKRAKLRRGALRIGARVYAEKPRAFEKRVDKLLSKPPHL